MSSLTTEATQRQDWFREVRSLSHEICAPLAIEDYGLQAVAETSPLKWHLAHTTWFFETFLLKPFLPGYRTFSDAFEVLFNSYYNSVGAQFPRAQRHLLSRPTVREVLDYRRHVDTQMQDLLLRPHDQIEEIARRLELGLHHEQQHQELMLTDLKYNFGCNPLYPTYRPATAPTEVSLSPLCFLPQPEQEVWIGQPRDAGFAFDNETPAHPLRVAPFAIADRLITNGEYLQFIEAGGYERPEFWLADGWAHIQASRWHAPLHWVKQEGQYREFSLHGLLSLSPQLPVTHISYYEADAFARWYGARLCTEFEWEAVARGHGAPPPALNLGWLHPAPADTTDAGVQQLFGSAWQWTQSAYLPYPGYRAAAGALGEYNGKFMCNQMVLRGSSCVTPDGHARASYRNFFYPHDRWQFMGIRLAQDL